jgi:hypothetical protein
MACFTITACPLLLLKTALKNLTTPLQSAGA